MTMIEKLENEMKELREKCEAQREVIEKNFSNTYKDVLDLNVNRSDYLIHDIRLLNFYEDSIIFIVEFEDGKTSYLDIKPGEINLNIR